MRNFALFMLTSLLCLSSCQPQPEEVKPDPRPPAALNYTLLGIWPDRFEATEMTNALGEAGIRVKLSGYQPCLINVEAAKLEQAQAIIAANPEWRQARMR